MQVTLKKENLWLFSLLFVVLLGLFFILEPKRTLEQRLYDSAINSIDKKDYKAAVDDLERIVSYVPDSPMALDAAKKGGNLCLYQIQDFNRAIFFFRHIVRHSQGREEIQKAQKQIAEIFYEKLSDYPQAVLEYHRILDANPEKALEEEVREKVARSYYYSGNFDQTILEIDELVKKFPENHKIFDLWALKASSYAGMKKYSDAIDQYDEILEKYSDRKDLDEIFINEAQAYEEMKDWDRAISTLQSARGRVAHEDIIEMKLKNLIQRKEKKKSR